MTDTTQEWTCVGKRRTTDNKLALFFLTPEGKERGFVPKKGLLRFARPGAVYAIKLNEEGKVLLADASYIRTEDSDRVKGWIVESEAEEASFEAERMVKKAGQDATLAAMLAPIREQYQKTFVPAKRRAILMAVMEAITR